MNPVISRAQNRRDDQRGINMVDLMMWLVIAAMLLATALQGIGYYQKAANLYQLKSNTDAAGTNSLTAAAKDDGDITLAAASDGIAATKWNDGVTSTVKTASDGTPYIVASSDSLSDTDAIYLFSACGEDYNVGVNVVSNANDPVLEECGITASPEGGAGSGVAPLPTGTMVSTWDTSLIHETETYIEYPDGTSFYDIHDVPCTSITVPIHGTMDVDIDWGDGTVERVTTPFPSHSYTTMGAKTVTINGSFTSWGGEDIWEDPSTFIKEWTPECITSVTEWGTTGTTSLKAAFFGADNLVSIAEIPSGVTTLEYALWSANSFNSPVNSWDVSQVTNMTGIFRGATTFNQDMSSWDTSKATDISQLFEFAEAFNKDISGWDTSSVTRMRSTFDGALSFSGDLSNWDTSNVTDMSYIFNNSGPANGDLSNWTTSKVITLEGAFNSSRANPNISEWDTSNVTSMRTAFYFNTSFDGDISQWDTSKVTNMEFMFAYSSFNGDITGWDTSNVEDMSAMFTDNNSFDKNIGSWDTSNVTDMSYMFNNSSGFNQNLSGWNVAKVTNYDYFWNYKPANYKPLFA
jgi:surface protein